MTIRDYIAYIKNEFALGKSLVELHHDTPEKLRKKLYKAMRRRGLLWMFAICDQSLFVRQ